jgi:rhodanese-related sulfurtransferase
MVQPQYIGSKEGSTLSELLSLCDALQLRAKSFSRLTVNSLHGATSPLVLHTSSQTKKKNYDHWTLFTGIENGKAMTWQVVNGQSTCVAIPLDDLAVQWDGNAIVVFGDYSTGVNFTFFVWMERIFVIGFVVLLWIVLVKVNSLFQRHENLITTSAVLCTVLFFSGLAYITHVHVLYPNSFLINDNAIRQIQEDHVIGFYPTAALNKVRKSYKNANVVIIDARTENQYQQGHIENSVNISYTMSLDEMEEVFKDYTKDTTIIVVYEPFACARAVDVFRKLKNLASIIFTDLWMDGINGRKRYNNDYCAKP